MGHPIYLTCTIKGIVPTFGMYKIGTVPTFKIHNIGNVPTFEIHNFGTKNIAEMMEVRFAMKIPSGAQFQSVVNSPNRILNTKT